MRLKDSYELKGLDYEVDVAGYKRGEHPDMGYQSSYFFFNNTVGQFPQFIFDDASPVPSNYNDEVFCMHLDWKVKGVEKNYADFKQVLNQEDCVSGPGKTKLTFPENKISDGVNFKLWKQWMSANCKGDSSCEDECKSRNGVFDSNGNCYAYQILDKVCASVGKVEGNEGEHHMALNTGCFADGSPGHYVWAKPSETYTFRYVPVYIRHMDDPYITIMQNDYDKGTDTSMFFTASLILTFIWFAIAIWLVIQYYKIQNMSPTEAA